MNFKISFHLPSMITLLSMLLYPNARVFAAPENEAVTTCSIIMATARQHDPLKYEFIMLSVRRLLASRSYSDTETCSTIELLEHLASTKRTDLVSDIFLYPPAIAGSGPDSMALLVDPRCDSCQLVLDFILAADKNCRNCLPKVCIALAPSSAPQSQTPDPFLTAVESTRSTDPILFLKHVRGFPLSPEEAGNESSRYRLTDQWALLSSNGISPPALLYHGRVIQRTTSDKGPALDPFSDPQLLLAILNLIDLSDKDKVLSDSH